MDQTTKSLDSETIFPLKNEFTFFYNKAFNNTTQSEKDYADSIMNVSSFGKVDEFWKLYNHLARPSNIPVGSSLHLFKKDTRPMWEDTPDGGIFTIKFNRRLDINVNQKWEDIVLAFIGGQFGNASDDLYGITYSSKKGDDRFTIWTKDASNEESKTTISELVKKIWDIPQAEYFEYQSNASKKAKS